MPVRWMMVPLLLLAAPAAASAAAPAVADEMPVPASAVGFLRVRVADLVRKLDLPADRGRSALLKEWRGTFGVELQHVEQLALVWLSDCHEPVYLLRLAGGARVKKSENRAVHAAGGRLFVVGPDKAHVKAYVHAQKHWVGARRFAEACRAPNDVVFWTSLLALRQADPLVRPSAARRCYYQPAGAFPLLALFPPPFFKGCAAAAFTLDVGTSVTVQGRLVCRGEAEAQRMSRVVPVLLDAVRAMLLEIRVELGMEPLVLADGTEGEIPPEVEKVFTRTVPLLKRCEKALQSARVETVRASVHLEAVLPVTPKALGRVATGWCSMVARGCSPDGCPVPTVPADVALPPPPPPPYVVPAPVYVPRGPQLPPPPPTDMVPAPTAAPSPSATPPAPVVLTPPATTPPSLKITVANVRGETALLFTMAGDGSLTFVRKLVHGDAADLDTAAGQRWVAVFAEKPGSERYTASAGDSKWILRQTSTGSPLGPVAPCTSSLKSGRGAGQELSTR